MYFLCLGELFIDIKCIKANCFRHLIMSIYNECSLMCNILYIIFVRYRHIHAPTIHCDNWYLEGFYENTF